MSRAVLDANVLISALLNPHGIPAKIVEEWRAGAFSLIVSAKLLAEVEQIVFGKLAGRLDERALELYLRRLREDSTDVPDPDEVEPAISRDPADDYLVALARAAGAHVIVTGDRHLLEQEGLTPPAVTPARFLMLLRALE